jgi:hypothetical protein
MFCELFKFIYCSEQQVNSLKFFQRTFKMPVKETIVVNKVPLETKFVDHPQYFSRYEQLYLELIENKTKIKQHLVNKDYTPPQHSSSDHSPQQGGFNKMFSPTTNSNSSKSSVERFTPESRDSKKISNSDPKERERLEKLEQQIETESIHSQKSQKAESVRSEDFKPPESVHSQKAESVRSEIFKPPESIKTESHKSEKSVKTESHKSVKTDSDKPQRQVYKGDSNASEKLQNMLGMNKSSRHASSGRDYKDYKDKYTSRHEDSRYEEYQKSRKRLPTLSELEKQGATTIRRELADAARLNVDDEDAKRELLFKFDLLRRSYREEQIPTYTIHTDLRMMQRSYEDTVRRLSLDSTVENYKRYLIGAFMLIEFVLGKYMKLDMKGYTQQQIVSMSSYEKLLIEVGEKAYMPEGEQWSVEMRLAFLVMINTAFFIVGKTVMANTGTNIMNAINGMNKAYQAPTPTPAAPPKKKMQGPNINLDDLPDVNDM